MGFDLFSNQNTPNTFQKNDMVVNASDIGFRPFEVIIKYGSRVIKKAIFYAPHKQSHVLVSKAKKMARQLEGSTYEIIEL